MQKQCINSQYPLLSAGILCEAGDVCLFNRSNSNEGLVQICIQDQLWSICSINWNVEDAKVVCRQLGLPYMCELKINFFKYTVTYRTAII